MAVITPQSDVYLLKVPLEIDNENQLTFATGAAQHTYFNSLPKIGYDDFTYIRKDGVLRIPAVMDDILSYNYVMYRNDAYSNKWFYAYITGMEYVNDSVTDVSIATDTFQTWQFDLTYKTTFVEREHVNDDTIGLHTQPEGLQLGEVMINSSTPIVPSKEVTDHDQTAIQLSGTSYAIFFQVTEFLSAYLPEANTYSNLSYNGVFSGLKFFACKSASDAQYFIQAYASAGKSDAIVAIFLGPKEFLQGAYKLGSGSLMYIPVDSTSVTELENTNTITLPTTLNGYAPKNKKLFTYPYSYMYVTNNAGADTTFNYEDFASNTPKFCIKGSLGQGCSTRLIPIGYKNIGTTTDNLQYGLVGAKYPVCSWASDYYTNWMAQNAGNINTGVVSSIATRALGFENASLFNNTTGMVGAAVGIATTIASTIAEVERAKIIPDQAHGNTSTSDMLVGCVSPSGTRVYFTVDCMSVRAENARIIDNYFTMFGYKVNTVKVPNITGRRNWNYVKTVGCYIEADIPQDDLQQIKDMFNRGITFWHNPTTFADYSQNNDII